MYHASLGDIGIHIREDHFFSSSNFRVVGYCADIILSSEVAGLLYFVD